MTKGSKEKYTDKQKRQADHIKESYLEKDVPEEKAEEIAWATVNKESGGGKKSGSGRAHKSDK
jgi:plasmid stabilization system protein ParE